MSLIQGVVPGIVKNVEDPDKRGRLEVYFPWLSDDNKSFWARVAPLMSGPSRGSWFMPEKDDEVLVAFEHGDAQHAYIVGYLWNGQDKPPNDTIDSEVTKLRRLRTVKKHEVDFDDRDNKEKIVVKSSKEHKVEIIDAPDSEKGIKVTSKGGHVIHMNDVAGKESVTVTTNGKHNIKMLDSPDKKIVVETQGSHILEMTDTPVPKISLKFKGQDPSITMDQQSMKMAFNASTYIEMKNDKMVVQFSPSSSIELSASSIKIVNNTLVEINP